MNELTALAVATTLAIGGLFSPAVFAAQRHQDDHDQLVELINYSNLDINYVQIADIDAIRSGADRDVPANNVHSRSAADFYPSSHCVQYLLS